jgi:hypothetical protein
MKEKISDNSNLKSRLLYKILSVIMLIQLILLLIICIYTSPASGYEINIYESVSLLFWIFIISIIIIAFFLIFHFSFVEYSNNTWILPFVILLIIEFIILVFPFIRGYFLIGGPNSDIFSHIGAAKNLQNSGFTENNFYPIIHIFVVAISDLLHVNITDVAKLIPTLFSILYSISLFILGKAIAGKKLALILSSFSFIFIYSTFSWSFHPSFFSFYMIPFLLYSYHKTVNSSEKTGYIIISIIFSIFIVFFHPLTSIITIIIFLLFIFSNFILNSLLNKKPMEKGFIRHPLFIFLLITICFSTWITSMNTGIFSIKDFFGGLFHGSEVTIASSYFGTFFTAHLTIIQSINFIFLNYGIIIILSIISYIFLIKLFIKIVKKMNFDKLELIYSIQLIGGFLCGLFFTVFISLFIEPLRALQYFLLMISIFNSFTIYMVISNSKQINFSKNKKIKKTHLIYCIMIFFIFLSSLSIFTLYPSSIIYSVNNDYTYRTICGSAWVVENSNSDFAFSSDVGFNYNRINQYINGYRFGETDKNIETIFTPSNFGYGQNDTIYKTFNYTETYLILTKQGLSALNVFPENVRPLVHQWSNNSINRLSNDQTAKKIYVNGEFECWLIWS